MTLIKIPLGVIRTILQANSENQQNCAPQITPTVTVEPASLIYWGLILGGIYFGIAVSHVQKQDRLGKKFFIQKVEAGREVSQGVVQWQRPENISRAPIHSAVGSYIYSRCLVLPSSELVYRGEYVL